MTRSLRFALGLLLLTTPTLAQDTPTTPLVDLARKVDVQIYRLTLAGALRTAGKDGAVNAHDLIVTINRKDGVFNPDAAAAAPSFNKAGHRGSVLKPDASLDNIALKLNIGSDAWVPGDEDAAYTLALKPDGDTVTGSFTGTFQGKTVKGELNGVVIRPGWYGCEDAQGKQHFSFDMGNSRGNWNRAKWGGFNFFTPIDISAFDGLVVTVTTDNPRHDAWIDLGVMEEDGSWYVVRDAIPLSQKTQTVRVHLDDLRHAEWVFNDTGTGGGADGNFDEDFHFDRTRLFRLALGLINAHGVGEVDFTVEKIGVAKWDGFDPAAPVEATVTGRTLAVNGQTGVPGGIFGFHTAGGSDDQADGLRVGSLRPLRAMGFGGSFIDAPNPDMGIFMTVSTQYDRKQQLPQFDDPNGWEPKARGAGRGMGNQAKPYADRDDVVVAAEWWNEPYLELGKFLEAAMAKKVAPGPDTKAGDPVVHGGKPLESMVWVKEGDTLAPKDPTRFTYWSGTQIAVWYAETFNAAAEEAKKISPHLRMIGGTGFRWAEDDWASWHILHKPIVDRSIEYLDGFCEHHYQGHTDAMPATYEVLNAYTIAKYGKAMPVYNTEANDLWDAPARGNAAATHQLGGTFTARRRMIYNLRDILGVIQQTPDKAEARAIHALWGGAKDGRSKVGQWVNVERDADFKADGLAFAETFDHRDADAEKTETVKSTDGKVFAVVSYTVKNTGKKDNAGYYPAQAELRIIDSDGNVTTAEPAFFDANKSDKRGGYAAPGKGAEGRMRMAFAVDPAHKNHIMQLVPNTRAKNKNKARIHVNGPFKPFEPSEWARRGINEGEYVALLFLRDLRGQLIETQSADRDVWVISSVDAKTMSQVTVVYNDSPFERTINLTLNPPDGATWSEPKAAMLTHDDTGAVGITELDAKVEVGHIPNTITLAPAHAWRAIVKLDKLPDAKPDVVREQVFAGLPDNGVDPILFDLAPGSTQPLVFDLGERAQGAKRAWVRVVLENTRRGDGGFTLGGQTFPLPHAHTPANGPYIREVEIDPALLTAKTSIAFDATAADRGGNGLRLCAASIVVEK